MCAAVRHIPKRIFGIDPEQDNAVGQIVTSQGHRSLFDEREAPAVYAVLCVPDAVAVIPLNIVFANEFGTPRAGFRALPVAIVHRTGD